MADLAEQIMNKALADLTKWDDASFQKEFEVRQMSQTPGFKILKEIWNDQKEVILNNLSNAKKEDGCWKHIGVLKGFLSATQIVDKFLREGERQREYLKNSQEQEE